jgi:threonylcarbamoyladenosine tRNA methylthiotransferase MtaB
VPGLYIQNFGCRATQADGAAIERQFEEHGLERAGTISDASIIVLNTCTVTASADQDARAAVRRAHRENPAAQIVVTGCYAQRAPEELASLPGVTQVIGNSHKHQLADIVIPRSLASDPTFVPLSTLRTENGQPRTALFVSDIFAHTELLAAPVFDAPNERTRPNLKVQDGCDNRCSFCVIPYVRGQSRSMKLDQVIQEARSLVGAGYRELVISGINLGRWGRDLDGSTRSSEETSGQRLVHLIRAILHHTELEKLRVSSVEPMDWTDELIGLVAESPRIAKHAHVPMQSGSDAVLRRMHRKYRPWHYRERILQIREAMPTAAIGADVMVGFPGESEAEFAETHRMIEELPFTYLHVFTYSARPGTRAADMPSQVPVPIARERSRILRELGEEKKLAFMRSFLGRSVEAITLAGGTETFRAGTPIRQNLKEAFTEALTDNYLKLRLPWVHPPNRWLRAQVQEVVDGSLMAAPA